MNQSREGHPWTLLMYMGWGGLQADHYEEAQEQLLEKIKKATKTLPNVELVYQFNRPKTLELGVIRRGERLPLGGSEPRSPIDILDPANLTNFLDWADKRFPNTRKALFIKDHGHGTQDTTLGGLESAELRGTEVGSGVLRNGHSFMPIPSFASAIQASRIGRLDFLAFDACQLGVVEVAYELRDAVSVMVASESMVDRNGIDYGVLLARLDQWQEAPTAHALGAAAVESSPEFKLIALELAQTKQIASAFDALGKELLKARKKVFDWASRLDINYTDGFQVAALIQQLRNAQLVDENTISEIETALAQAIVPSNRDVYEISVFLPTRTGSQSIATYGASAFARDTSWAEFVGTLNYDLMTNGIFT